MLAAAIGGYVYYDRYFSAPASQTAAGRQERAAPVDVVTAETAPMATQVEAVGTTRAARSVRIVPLASGRVVELRIEPGREVTRDDVLVRLDDDIQRADLAEAEANLVEKKQAVERATALRPSNTVSAATLEQVRAAATSATAAVDRAKRRLADRTVRAPFDGVAGLTSIDVGARVTESDVITTLDDLSEVEIEFAAPETLYAAIKPGMAVEARGAAFGDRVFVGKISSVDTRIDSASRAFKVRALLPNRERTLPAGMFMYLAVTLSERQAVIVPDEAIIAEGAETFVYVVRDGKAFRRVVVTGQRSGTDVEIVSGLEPGETVVLRGHQSLREGMAVRILSQRKSGEPPTSMTTGERPERAG
ncbi:MAG: efflux RND transporter periplasmic adaptor subunit [Rhodobiaceae bacterium]|nr:efflux RND transporter periplasmic adaptor subunit [Rhodobiaceae bacterium]